MSRASRGSVSSARPFVLPPPPSNGTFTENFATTLSPTYWGTANFSTGSTVDINNSQLRMLSGTLGAYLDYQYQPLLATYTDIDMRFDVIIPLVTSEQYAQIGFRGSGSQDTTTGHRGKQTTGYFIEIGTTRNYIGVYRRTAGADTALLNGVVGVVWANNDTVHVRVKAIGNSIKFKVWRNAQSEPTTWNVSTNDSNHTTGKVWFGRNDGNDATADALSFDNLVIDPNPIPDSDPVTDPGSTIFIETFSTSSLNATYWGAPNISSGSTLDINNSQLRMLGGTLGSYLDFQYLPLLTTYSDIDMKFDVVLPVVASELYTHTGFRGSGTQDTIVGHKAKQTSGYFIEIGTGPGNNYIALIKRTAGADSTLGVAGVVWVNNDIVHVRVKAIGPIIKFKVWRNAETEPPTTWNVTYTDNTSPYLSGKVWFACTDGSNTVPDTIRYDNITIDPNPVQDTTPPSTTLPASAISGMSSTPYKNYDWTGTAPLTDWYVVDGAGAVNLERSASKPSNVTFQTDDPLNTSGGVYMRLFMRRESYAGLPYTGVQMENFYSGPAPGRTYGTQTLRGYGQGSPFYVESRVRWTGFLGFWCGPWMYDLTPPGAPAEVDIMETINDRPAKTTLHSPNVATFTYVGGNDGQWHTFGQRFDRTGVYYYMDNALVNSVVNASIGSGFVDANMGFKCQAYVGGIWPDDDAGLPRGTLPYSSEPFPHYFDVDYIRLYR